MSESIPPCHFCAIVGVKRASTKTMNIETKREEYIDIHEYDVCDKCADYMTNISMDGSHFKGVDHTILTFI